MDEAIVEINGTLCTAAMSMTIRVAIEAFAMDLQDGLGDDEHGKSMTEAYSARLREIRQLMYK